MSIIILIIVQQIKDDKIVFWQPFCKFFVVLIYLGLSLCYLKEASIKFEEGAHEIKSILNYNSLIQKKKEVYMQECSIYNKTHNASIQDKTTKNLPAKLISKILITHSGYFFMSLLARCSFSLTYCSLS